VRTLRLCVLALCALVCGLVVPTTTAAATRKPCEIAREGVDEFLAGRDRAATVAELHAFVASMAKSGVSARELARAYVNSLDPAGKSAFWRDHVGSFLVQPLSDGQRSVIEAVIERLTPDLFERAAIDGASTRSELEQVKSMIDSVFDEADAAVLTGLAPDAFSASLLPSVSQQASRLGKAAQSATTMAFIDCTCDTYSDLCYANFFCVSGMEGGGCYYKSTGCGLFFAFPCDGVCCRLRMDGTLNCPGI